MKTLRDLLHSLKLQTESNIEILELTTDSRNVKPGTLFCALKGLTVDGHDFVEDAIKRGASAILCERPMPYDHVFVVPDLYHRLGRLADFFYEHPSQKLKLIGVTGTNGKTSTSHYLAQLLYLMGEKAALIGTVGNGLWGALSESTHTTPDVLTLHKLLKEFVDQGVTWAVMEVSSHALEQNRVDGAQFHGAVFTNLTQDHLDYHKTMDAYGRAKAKLFERPELKVAVFNEEDFFSQTLIKKLPLSAKAFFYGCATSIKTNLLGSFNLSNLNATLTLLAACEFPLQELEKRATLLQPVKGRMEGIRYEKAPLIVIDYAHTPDALSKAIGALKNYPKIWVIFGCGGDRDPTKRPLMAKAVENLADEIIVTEDNSRLEAVQSIFADIRKGFSAPEKVHFIEDRTQAIGFALSQAHPEDIILLAGKGHETYLDKNNQKIHYDEREIIASFLKPKN